MASESEAHPKSKIEMYAQLLNHAWREVDALRCFYLTLSKQNPNLKADALLDWCRTSMKEQSESNLSQLHSLIDKLAPLPPEKARAELDKWMPPGTLPN